MNLYELSQSCIVNLVVISGSNEILVSSEVFAFMVSLPGRLFAKNTDSARVHFWFYLLVTRSCSLSPDSYLFRKKNNCMYDRVFHHAFMLWSLDSLPCMLFLICLRDTFKQDKRKFKDPRRLYAPGRMYHIVERKFCR
jgi:hypothetical protein